MLFLCITKWNINCFSYQHFLIVSSDLVRGYVPFSTLVTLLLSKLLL